MGETQVDASFQPGSHFTGHVRTKVETLVAGFECNTFIVQVAGRKEVLISLSTTGNTQIQFGTKRLLLHRVTPVGVP